MFTIYFFLDNCQRCNFSRVFQVVMSNFEKIEGKRKGSINYVHQGFIYTKNDADSIKTRLRCHRWRNRALFVDPIQCEEDDEEDYDLCSGCDEKPIAHLVQPRGHMLCVNCVKKKKCQLCGSQIFNNVTIDFEDLS